MKEKMQLLKKITAWLVTSALAVSPCVFQQNVYAEEEINITLGTQRKISEGVFKVPVTVTGNASTYSVTLTNSRLKLTSVSGDGYRFINGVIDDKNADKIPQTGKSYMSVQLSATSKESAVTALNSITYCSISDDAELTVSCTQHEIKDNDFYLNGHFYTLNPEKGIAWKDAMEWAFNLHKNDQDRYQGYRSYPVVVTTLEENQMLVNIWANNESDRKSQIWLPAVPSECKEDTGSITVEKGENGIITVNVEGEPECSGNMKQVPYGNGTFYKWMDETPEAGRTLPLEYLPESGNGEFWSQQNPENGGVVYFGHPSFGAYWDDLDVSTCSSNGNIWTGKISETNTFNMYALAEWEPESSSTATVTRKKFLSASPVYTNRYEFVIPSEIAAGESSDNSIDIESYGYTRLPGCLNIKNGDLGEDRKIVVKAEVIPFTCKSESGETGTINYTLKYGDNGQYNYPENGYEWNAVQAESGSPVIIGIDINVNDYLAAPDGDYTGKIIWKAKLAVADPS